MIWRPHLLKYIQALLYRYVHFQIEKEVFLYPLYFFGEMTKASLTLDEIIPTLCTWCKCNEGSLGCFPVWSLNLSVWRSWVLKFRITEITRTFYLTFVFWALIPPDWQKMPSVYPSLPACEDLGIGRSHYGSSVMNIN